MRNFRKTLRDAFFCACLAVPQAVGAAPEAPSPASPPSTVATQKDFSRWLRHLRKEAAEKGISQQVIDDALPGSLRPIDRVLQLDRKQPEGTKKLDEYLTLTVSPARVGSGLQKMESYKELLQTVSDAYDVEPEIIVALWGMESGYGKITGGYQIVNALATLAYDGRRSAYFRGELFKALEILQEEHMTSASLKGSWAGAMGQCQFMPSSFFTYAVDFNKDGHRDIWGTEADVFASAANYLSKSGWKKGEPWGRRVQLPAGFDRSLLRLEEQHSLQFWNGKGLNLPSGDTSSAVSVIQPDGAGTSAYAVYHNFRVILKWNRSNYFATSIGLLSDKLKGP